MIEIHTQVRLFNTVKYLNFKQIYYRIFYTFRKNMKLDVYKIRDTEVPTQKLAFTPFLKNLDSYVDGSFTFLNIQHTFSNGIDWNYNEYGKLWTYNLTYFDFLNQESMTKEIGLELINDFIDNIESIKDGLEPFPISLRGINWIKFLSQYEIEDHKINASLYYQYNILLNNLEYHLLGNHLLENAFSLLYGAYYFQDEAFYKQAKKLLLDELNEQILEDGAHFELSPMYHQIMLYRVLDCINLVINNRYKDDELLEYLVAKAEIMLSWLNRMTYKDGSIPLLNDSANGIAPSTGELNTYAKALGISAKESVLKESGYRKFTNNSYELIVDVGNIGPDYIPGHAHSDTFNFELYVQGKPVIVDTGLSTYETNERRMLERSTQSHNTVVVNDRNQSEVWGGFRVAKRAKIIDLEEGNDFVKATHDGYKHFGLLHTRSFRVFEKKIVIEDTIEGKNKAHSIAYLHLYPGIDPVIQKDEIVIDNINISVSSDQIKVKEYLYAPAFNTLIPAKVVEIQFEKNLKMELTI